VAFRLDGAITILPVAHVVDGVDVCFRTAGSSKIQAALDRDEVAFEADGYDIAERSGWSVLMQGPAVEVTSEPEIRALEDRADAPWIHFPDEGTVWIRVRAESISGRELPIRS
jgi:nitroimidazol reductase NimA-like FMN-containing flavoprotein (pyridoxamine 5'-phosphate oxidase superfamily)